MSTYRIVRQASGAWNLYEDDRLLDSDADPEQADLDSVLRWAEDVIHYEGRVRIRSWVAVTRGDGQVERQAQPA